MRANNWAMPFPDPYPMIQNTSTAVPRLFTALAGPLQDLERRFPASRKAMPRLGTRAPGMQFEPPVFAVPCSGPDRAKNPDDCANRRYASGVAAPAAAREQPRAPAPSVSEPKTTASRQ